jgi:hypothetical protein
MRIHILWGLRPFRRPGHRWRITLKYILNKKGVDQRFSHEDKSLLSCLVTIGLSRRTWLCEISHELVESILICSSCISLCKQISTFWDVTRCSLVNTDVHSVCSMHSWMYYCASSVFRLVRIHGGSMKMTVYTRTQNSWTDGKCNFKMLGKKYVWFSVRDCGYRSRGPGFDFRPYQLFWEVGGLEQGALSLMRTIEELLEWKSSGSGLENRD